MRLIMTLMTAVTLSAGAAQAGEWDLVWSDEIDYVRYYKAKAGQQQNAGGGK